MISKHELAALIETWRTIAADREGDSHYRGGVKYCADALSAAFAHAAASRAPSQDAKYLNPTCASDGCQFLQRLDCGLTASDIYHVMQAWEAMPASEDQTRIVIGLGQFRDWLIQRGDSPQITALAAGARAVPPEQKDEFYYKQTIERPAVPVQDALTALAPWLKHNSTGALCCADACFCGLMARLAALRRKAGEQPQETPK